MGGESGLVAASGVGAPLTTSLGIEDELAIRNLYASYCHLMDTGDAKAWCDCFVRDGVLSIPTQSVRIQGRQNLGPVCRRLSQVDRRP